MAARNASSALVKGIVLIHAIVTTSAIATKRTRGCRGRSPPRPRPPAAATRRRGLSPGRSYTAESWSQLASYQRRQDALEPELPLLRPWDAGVALVGALGI